jgi:thiamine biosynthesis protein ThiS
VFITLNGEPFEIDQPLSMADLLARLAIDPRRVAVEHNLEILRRNLFADTMVHGGDRIEIVNFVGGGDGRPSP